MNGQSVDVCITIIYDSGLGAHDITRFRAAFTLNCSVAVILKDETPVLSNTCSLCMHVINL